MRRSELSRPDNSWWKQLHALIMILGFFHPFVVIAVVFVANDQCSCFSILGRIPKHQHAPIIYAHHSFETVTDRSGHCKQLWDLPNGLKMEVIVSSKIKDNVCSGHHSSDLLDTSRRKLLSPPIVFIHGSFHAAWCYSEHYMSYFSSLGYDCYSISLRGTSGTIQPSSDYYGDKIKVEQHVEDVSMVLDRIYDIYNPTNSSSSSRSLTRTQEVVSPVVIAHSFGGLILMKLLEICRIRDRITAVALLCSVPPSGNAEMTKRFLKRDWLIALKIVWGFVFKGNFI